MAHALNVLFTKRMLQSRNVRCPVLRIRVRRIHMFWGLLDPDPDPVVRGMDPDPDPSIVKQK
jgi:hypothetical protein